MTRLRNKPWNRLLFIQNISSFLIGSNLPANPSLPASVDQIWKTIAISSKMTSVVLAITRKKGRQRRRSPGDEVALAQLFWYYRIVIHLGLQPRWITSSSIGIILHVPVAGRIQTNLVPRAFPIEIGRGGKSPAPPNFYGKSPGNEVGSRPSDKERGAVSKKNFFRPSVWSKNKGGPLLWICHCILLSLLQ